MHTHSNGKKTEYLVSLPAYRPREWRSLPCSAFEASLIAIQSSCGLQPAPETSWHVSWRHHEYVSSAALPQTSTKELKGHHLWRLDQPITPGTMITVPFSSSEKKLHKSRWQQTTGACPQGCSQSQAGSSTVWRTGSAGTAGQRLRTTLSCVDVHHRPLRTQGRSWTGWGGIAQKQCIWPRHKMTLVVHF